SSPDSQHSQNLLRTGNAFIAIYDSKEHKQGGLYIQTSQARELYGNELAAALAIHDGLQNPQPIEYYTTGPQRIYAMTPTAAWVHMRKNDASGVRIKDYRQPVELKEIVELL